MVSGVGVISFVRAIINRLRGLSDADLRELSAAVDAERNHRGHGEDGGESSPSPDQNREVAPVAPPPASWFADVPMFIAPYGRVWHKDRSCYGLRRARAVWELDTTSARAMSVRQERRPCKVCCPLHTHPWADENSGVTAEADRTYRGGLVPAKFVRDQWGRWVKMIFSIWQTEVDCMASSTRHQQRWRHVLQD